VSQSKRVRKRYYQIGISFNNVFKASTGIYFKSAEMFPGCLRVLIRCLMPTFCEHCGSFHQGEKQPDTISTTTLASNNGSRHGDNPETSQHF